MKNRIVIVFALLFTASVVAAQTPREQTILNVFGRLNLAEDEYENLNRWTDGFAYYRPFFSDLRIFENTPRANGDTIYLFGGTCHEGGFGNSIALAADGTMRMAGDYQYTEGDRVEYRVVGAKPLLIISDVRTKAVKTVLKKMGKEESLRAFMYDAFRRLALAGTYRSADGKTITFSGNDFCVSGLWDASQSITYTFDEEYETPVLTIVHPNKDKAYIVRKTLTGLELFPAKFDIEVIDWWEKDPSKPSLTLVKTAEAWSNLPLDGKQGIRGRFTLASEQVMTRGELRLYAGTPSLQNLKIMRNEIFARHGYKFKTKDMADYFGAQAWYVPQYDDVTTRLTDIEHLNIALIQELEKKYEDYWNDLGYIIE
jgi:hypothetical protein